MSIEITNNGLLLCFVACFFGFFCLSVDKSSTYIYKNSLKTAFNRYFKAILRLYKRGFCLIRYKYRSISNLRPKISLFSYIFCGF